MSLVHFQFESQCLCSNTDVTVILPDKPRDISPAEFYASGKKYRVLWLLHGTFGDYSDWLRKSNIELYACERDLIVVMPSALNAMYENWSNFCLGYQSFNYLFDELMPLVYNWFPASDKPCDNFIAGLSMGGRGALRYALAHPEKFGGVASMSYIPLDFDDPENAANLKRVAALDRRALESHAGTCEGEFSQGATDLRQRNDMDKWGGMEAYLASPENLWPHMKDWASLENAPKLYLCCGTDDPLMYTNGNYDKFLAYLESLGIDFAHSEGPGAHEWRVWDRDIQLVLDSFGIHNESRGNAF